MDMGMGPGSSCGGPVVVLKDITTSPEKARITSIEKVSFTVKEDKGLNKPGPASKTGRAVSRKPVPINTTEPSGSRKRRAMYLSSDSDTEGTEVMISADEEADDDRKDEPWGFHAKQHPKPLRVCSTELNGTLKRPQGRPAKTGEYVGLAEARRQANKQEEISLRQTAERELIEQERERRESRIIFTQKIAEEVAANPDRMETARRSLLLRQVSDAVATVEKVATSSKKLKSTYIKYLRDAAMTISSASKQLGDLTSSEEVTKLEMENVSLRAENSSLKETISRLQSDVEDIKKEIRGMVGKPTSPPGVATLSPPPQCNGDVREPPPRRYETRSGKRSLPPRGNINPLHPSLHNPLSTPLPDDGFGDEMEVEDKTNGLPNPKPAPTKGTSPEVPPHSVLQNMMGEVIRQVGDIVSARFAAIEGRLLPEEKLRPPLQGDKRRTELPTVPPQRIRQKVGAPITPPPTLGQPVGVALPPTGEAEWKTVKGKGKKGKSTPAPPLPAPTKGNKIAPSGPTKQAAKTPMSYAEAARMEKKGGMGTSKGPSRKGELPQKKPGKPSSGPRATESIPGQPKGKSPPKKAKKPPRRTAAITLSLLPPPEGQQGETITSMAEVLKVAKEKIDLKEMGIEYLRPKRAVTGALILEVPGEGSSLKADNLAAKLSQVVRDLGVKVARPVKCVELRVTKLDDAATCENIALAIAELGGCAPADIKVAPPRRAAQGLFAAWVRCPETAAYRVAKAGKVTVGWAQAKVESLKARPLQCYRCLEFGHTRQRCTATTDRGNICYRCSQSGHLAVECTNAPYCTLCAGKGLKATHRMGGNACPLAAPVSKKKKTTTTPARSTKERTTRERTTRDSSKTGPRPAPTAEKGKAVPPTAQLPSSSNKGDAKSPPNKEDGLEEAMDTTQ